MSKLKEEQSLLYSHHLCGKKSIWRKKTWVNSIVSLLPVYAPTANIDERASRTSKNTILLLLTEMEHAAVNITHSCTICSQLQWKNVMKQRQNGAAEAKPTLHRLTKRRKWNKIQFALYFRAKCCCSDFPKWICELCSGVKWGRESQKTAIRSKKVWAMMWNWSLNGK